jgi:uncharacterized membrane protein YfcA
VDLPSLSALAWAGLVIGAMIVGVSKTGLPGANTLGIALFAAALPAKESTGAMLLLLILGDVMALSLYRRHADWKTIIRLAPSVIAGLALGAIFLALVGDTWVKRSIGVLLIVVVLLTLWRRRGAEVRPGRGSAIANAGGPPMSMYFLASRFSVHTFLGTAAWFFAIINIVKLPISIGLGIITVPTLWIDLILVVPVLVGAAIGRYLITKLSQKTFETIVVVLTLVGAVYLVF